VTITTVVGAVIVDSVDTPTRLVAARRSGSHAGRWEFPGGKVESEEDAKSAVVREVLEELGALTEVASEVAPAGSGWAISDALVLRLFLVRVVQGTLMPGTSHDLIEWVGSEEIDELDWLPSDRSALASVRRSLGW